MILDSLDVDREQWEKATGWQLKAEGACQGDVCVPVDGMLSGGTVNAAALAERLGMPLVHDDDRGLWASGPATVTGRALTSAVLPDLELPDLEGRPFRLSSLRGRKVVMVAWASW
jgi:hypothetical protein